MERLLLRSVSLLPIRRTGCLSLFFWLMTVVALCFHFFPIWLTCFISPFLFVIGHRMLAMSILPIDHTTLRYGSDDGGRTVHDDHLALTKKMKEAAVLLNIAPHLAGVHQQRYLHSACVCPAELSVCLFVCLFVCLSVFCLSVSGLSVCISVFQSVSQSLCPSVCLSVSLSVHSLFVCLPLCSSVSAVETMLRIDAGHRGPSGARRAHLRGGLCAWIPAGNAAVVEQPRRRRTLSRLASLPAAAA
jgi:hypothetical protein